MQLKRDIMHVAISLSGDDHIIGESLIKPTLKDVFCEFYDKSSQIKSNFIFQLICVQTYYTW